jgi:hypothetical protein
MITKEQIQQAVAKSDLKAMRDIYFQATGKRHAGGCGSCAMKFLKRFCTGYLKQL